MGKNPKDIINAAISSVWGNASLECDLKKCIETGKKFQIQINGFSGNISNTRIIIQIDGKIFKHYTF
jgi:hypothetical protein